MRSVQERERSMRKVRNKHDNTTPPTAVLVMLYRWTSLIGVQEILQLSIPEEHRNAAGSKEITLYNFNRVLREDATQEVGMSGSRRSSPRTQGQSSNDEDGWS